MDSKNPADDPYEDLNFLLKHHQNIKKTTSKRVHEQRKKFKLSPVKKQEQKKDELKVEKRREQSIPQVFTEYSQMKQKKVLPIARKGSERTDMKFKIPLRTDFQSQTIAVRPTLKNNLQFAPERSQRGRLNQQLANTRINTQSVQKHNKNACNISYFSFIYLKELSTISSEEAMVKIAKNEKEFEKFLNTEMRPDFFVITLRVLINVCQSSFSGTMTKIINYVFSTNFLKNLENYLKKLPFYQIHEQLGNKLYYEDINRFWCILVELFQKIIDLAPRTACDKLIPVLKIIEVIIPSIEISQKYKMEDKIKNDISSMINDLEMEVIKISGGRTLEVGKEETTDESSPPESFRDLSVFPTTEDLFNDEVYLRKCKIKDPYDSVSHYLDVQYRLLREDFVKPLRNGIKEYLNDRKKYRNNDLRIYKNTKLRSFKINEFSAGISLYFGKLKFIDWRHSKRLIFGTLLLLSKDNFSNIIFATVSDRNEKNLLDGYVTIEPCIGTVIKPHMYNCNLVLLESKIYFEPYFAVLTAMKNIYENNFPMEKYLVRAESSTRLPKYIDNVKRLKFKDKFILPLDNIGEWPTAKELKLDDSQYVAFKNALSQEFAVIQGPPGTGKTFLALQIVEALLENKTNWLKHGPIVVVCLTNHALDQFLEGILHHTKSIVRIGTRSKNKNLMKYVLRFKREQFNRCNASLLIHNKQRKIEQILTSVSRLHSFIKYLSNPNSIVPLQAFQNCHDKVPLNTFKSTEELVNWLIEMRVLIEETKAFENVILTEMINEEIKSEKSTNEYTFDAYENVYTDVDILYDYRKLLSTNPYRPFYVLQFLDNQIEITKNLIYHLSNDLAAHLPFSPIIIWQNYLDEITQKRDNIQQELSNHPIVNQLNKPTNNPRWQQYWSWIRISYDYICNEIFVLESEYRQLDSELRELKQLADLEVMKQHEVIGLTTSCAAKIQSSLQALKAPIVLVEEAAEILEAHVVCSMTKDCQHVILIGDHKQLRPKSSVYELGTKYNLNTSLFERMVNIKGECTQLAYQHRMRPQIAKLITPSIYDTLHNHESVFNYPHIKGLDKNLYFINHTSHEETYKNDDSWMNIHEVKFLTAFTRHLLMQGYCPEDITILCTYTGQLFAFMNELRLHTLLNSIRVTTVDNFQGEENKIILLSLVRSNGEGNVGFLKEENRVCVALSRAREGLYIMGNMKDLLVKNSIWPKINKVLEDENAIGDNLKLRCQIHEDQFFEVKNANDFKQCSEGGCSKNCEFLLSCGHYCTNICHVLDREHKQYKCKQKCNGVCPNNHLCELKCWEGCKPCLVKVERTLKCDHTISIPCSADENTFSCFVEVEVTLPDCNHVVKKPCGVPVEKFKCTSKCEIRLDCGHSCLKNCHVRFDPDHLNYICNKKCNRKNIDCSENHTCNKKCCEACEPCSISVDKKRSCNHFYPNVKCSLNLEVEFYCKHKCNRKMSCGHMCTLNCSDECKNCQEMVLKKSSCSHLIKIKCCEEASPSKCNKQCKKTLLCGHPCKKKCNDRCTVACKEMIPLSEPGLCGHTFSIPCYLMNSDPKSHSLIKYCREPCNVKLACEHNCKGNCGSCFQGRMHISCTEPCRVVFICGHSCKIPCNQECQPCKEKCELKCGHTKCNKKCGEPCVSCKEPCKRRCDHKSCRKLCHEMCDIEPCNKHCNRKLRCNHPCVGFCGEPCPPLCRICDEVELTTIFLGYEDEPNARFVLLPDCNHTIENKGLMMHVKLDAADSNGCVEINTPTCPLCKTPIKNCNRIMNTIREALKNVMIVKKKLFYNNKDLENKQQEYVEKLKNMKECITYQSSYDFNNFKNYIQGLIKLGSHINNKKKQTLSYVEVFALEKILDILAEIFSVLKKWKKTKISFDMINDQVCMIIECLPCKLQISQQRLDDVQLEMRRLHLMVNISNQYPDEIILMSEFKKNYDFLKEQLTNIKKFTQNVETNVIKSSKALNDLSVIIERKMIVKAMNVKKGAWYKCKNGHFYAIGNCGGANQKAQCPECKAPIGGMNYRIDSTNSLATEMDGAVTPIWPTAFNN